MIWLVVLAVGVVAGTIGGLVGFGSNLMLLPILVYAFGPLVAVPMLTIAGLMTNVSRVAVWWREVDWRAAGVYALGAVPGAALGARTLVTLNPRLVQIGMGLCFLAMIPVRRALQARGFKVSLWHLAIVGGAIGFLGGMVLVVGPVNTPFFLAYGLVKGPFVSTEALGSALIGLTKTGVFSTFGALPADVIARGVLVGASVTVGSWLSKHLMDKVSPAQFRGLMDAVLALAGALLIAGAI
jgi:uncharacterized membrane protein YfcA